MSSLRILGGEWRGRRLRAANGTRPTGGRLREALFSIWRADLAGAAFLDLYAGSGAVGLEALSRGAARAVFVECSPRSLAALRDNCAALAPEKTRIWRLRLPAGLGRRPAEGFDRIFADPPYRFVDHDALLRRTAAWRKPASELAIEHSTRVELPAAAHGWRRFNQRRYGESALSLYRPDVEGEGIAEDGQAAYREG